MLLFMIKLCVHVGMYVCMHVYPGAESSILEGISPLRAGLVVCMVTPASCIHARARVFVNRQAASSQKVDPGIYGVYTGLGSKGRER